MSPSAAVRLTTVAILLVAGTACGDQPTLHTTSSTDGERTITPQVMVRTDGKTTWITLVLDGPASMEKIGSYTGRVRFDSAALAFEAEVDQGDGVLRASNAEAGVVRIAGVGRTGIDPAHLAAFRFAVRKPDGLQSITFDLDELHEVSHADLRPLVRRGAAPRILK